MFSLLYADVEATSKNVCSEGRDGLQFYNIGNCIILLYHVWDYVFHITRKSFASKLIPGMSSLSYEGKLRKIGLPTLTFRRARGDMIEVHKILHHYKADASELLTLSDTNVTRGHTAKLRKKHSRTELSLHSFTNRVINNWNSLSESVISAPSTDAFKKGLDK